MQKQTSTTTFSVTYVSLFPLRLVLPDAEMQFPPNSKIADCLTASIPTLIQRDTDHLVATVLDCQLLND